MRYRTRRQFLNASAAACAAGVVGLAATRRSAALTFEDSDAKTAEIYANHCSLDNRLHEQLIDEALAKFDVKLSPEQRRAAIAGLTCPFCGCRLA